MTATMKRAITKAERLPHDIQDVIATQLLEDIEAELKWERTLASAKSQKFLEKMAKKALKDLRSRKTINKGFDAL